MARIRQNLTAIEILLVGYWLFYGSMVATNAAFYGERFAVMLGLGLPMATLCGWCLVRRPFLTIASVGLLTWIAKASVSQWPDLARPGLAYQAVIVGILLGMPLPLVTQRAWARRRRLALEDRRAMLARFEWWAVRVVSDWGVPSQLLPRQREFQIEIGSGAAFGRLNAWLETGQTRRFDNELALLESELEEISRDASRAGGFEAGHNREPADPYDVLACSPNSSPDDIKRAYRLYCKFYHPDAVSQRGGDEEMAHRRMKEGNLAFEEIKRRKGMQ